MTETNERPAKRPRGSLTAEEVLDAALVLIDTHGLDGLSMRNLGDALGVNHMTPYRFFASRAALLDALADREARRFPRDPALVEKDPRQRIRNGALHIRRVLLEHPYLAPVVISRPLSKSAPLTALRSSRDALDELGIPAEHQPRVGGAILTYGLGFVLYETGVARYRATMGEELAAEHRAVVAALEAVPDAGAEVHVMREFVDGFDSDEQFLFGLDALLEGCVARYAAW